MNDKYLIEVSWEVCNKVGGIYTVVSTKAAEAVNAFADNYLTVGPLLAQNPGFQEERIPELRAAVKALKAKKITAKAGRWDIDGKPKVLLVDFQEAVSSHDRLLYQLWEDFGVDSMYGHWDYVEPILFSTACGMAIEEVYYHLPEETQVTAHFHEWMSGAGLLYLKKNVPAIANVFTTHATVVGRAVSGAGHDLYGMLDSIQPLAEAKKHNVGAKHSIEMVAAHEADCFATVSEITALECEAILASQPLVTPNGFTSESMPDFAADKDLYAQRRGKLLEFSSMFLHKKLDPRQTFILSTSGRYEYHNKGIDVLVESLKKLEDALKEQGDSTQVVAFFLVLGGYAGVHEEALLRVQHTFSGMESATGISTHHLTDVHHDPLINACKRLNLLNAPENQCNIIFIPAYLDGHDGILNVPYYDVLAGCDLAVFASNYEPWGYTPLESIACSVPAVTTDKAGFGQWIKSHFADASGVIVIDRIGQDYDTVVDCLNEQLKAAVHWNNTDKKARKKNARAVSLQITWSEFYPHYKEAYQKAEIARNNREEGLKKQQEIERFQESFAGTNAVQPHLRPFAIVAELPQEIERLKDLAYSMWWVWHRDARELFAICEPALWEATEHNPVAMIQNMDRETQNEIIQSDYFMSLYNDVVQQYDSYCHEKRPLVDAIGTITPETPVAYFSMEFGIHECMPIYSGGLGVLSGDHLKSASDLNLPLIGISLLYKYGYFRQRINREGHQVTVYEQNKFAEMPIQVARNRRGEDIRISVELPGRTLCGRVWQAQVGRARLYLIDTDIDENSRKDRDITARLYDSSTRERIEQEILLGIGGMRLIRQLEVEPAVYHLNEGHSAFMLIEQLRMLTEEHDLDFETACEVVRSRTVFTTHTPVPAGNEQFAQALIQNYFQPYIENSGISWEHFWNLGHVFTDESSNYQMTVVALKLANARNGVSRLHAQVAREMWRQLWPGFLAEESPIVHITNGVHFPSWIANEILELLESYAGVNVDTALMEPDQWHGVSDIPANLLWRQHNALKTKLFDLILDNVQMQWTHQGEDPTLIDRFRSRLNPAALTIGFARRFAAYKRPTLLLRDFERLKKLLLDRTYPVQIVFAGKAHPADTAGQEFIREITHLAKQEDFLGKIIFVEDYNIRVARALVAGVDVWLNNPVRPMEASGTSGMKAAMNGVLNCSILDGWWDEAYTPEIGWVIGDRNVPENRETVDLRDAESLYNVLEEKIIPLFYGRDKANIPERWVTLMKNCMQKIIPAFNARRMMRDYIVNMYEPTSVKSRRASENNFELAKDLAEWKRKIPQRFSGLRIGDIRIKGLTGDVLNVGDSMFIRVRIESPKIAPEELLVELVIKTPQDEYSYEEMRFVEQQDKLYAYELKFTSATTGKFRYGIRVIPVHRNLETKYDTGLVYWG